MSLLKKDVPGVVYTVLSEQVIATALQALERGRMVVIDGQSNAFIALSVRFVPRRLVTRIGGQLFRPNDGKAKVRVNAIL